MLVPAKPSEITVKPHKSLGTWVPKKKKPFTRLPEKVKRKTKLGTSLRNQPLRSPGEEQARGRPCECITDKLMSEHEKKSPNVLNKIGK